MVLLGFAFVLAVVTPAASTPPEYVDAVMADGPSAYWRLNEAPGATTAADSSGNGITGTYNAVELGIDSGLETDPDTAVNFPDRDSAPSGSDAFSTARLIVGSTGYTSDYNTEATKEIGEPNHAGNAGGKSLWFSWRAPSSGIVTFETAGSKASLGSGGPLDTLLAVYTGTSLTALTTIAANDDVKTTDVTSKISFTATAGVVYRIAVDGKNGAYGSIQLLWIQGTLPPANDAFVQVETIGSGSGSRAGTNINATKESGEPNHAGNAGGKSVWYRWIAPGTGTFQFLTHGSDFNTLLAVYTGSTVSGLTLVAANDDSMPQFGYTWSSVTFSATYGTEYRIAVDGFRSSSKTDSGRISLGWSSQPHVNFGDRFDFAGNAPFSVEAWVSPEASGTIVGKYSCVYDCTYSDGYILGVSAAGPGTVSAASFARYRDYIRDEVSISPLPADTWNHIVGTYDGSRMVLYVNGVEVASTASPTPLADTASPLYIGWVGWGGTFLGELDEVAVYPTALSAARVAAHYDSGTAADSMGDEPQLTDEERTRAIAIATGDARFTSVVGGRPYEVTAAGAWLTVLNETKMGATLSVKWAEPATITYAWPVIDYDSSETTSPPYTEGTESLTATNLTQLDILVDLQRGVMVAMEPGGRAETIPTSSASSFGLMSREAATATAGVRCTRKLRRYHTGLDWFWNYDFTTKDRLPSRTASRCDVDWPVNLIFWGNASVAKVEGLGAFREDRIQSTKHARMKDARGVRDPRGAIPFGTFWDDNNGSAVGENCIGTKRHFRVYAPGRADAEDRLYNLTYEFYVFATTHKDHNETCRGEWFGESEDVEEEVGDEAEDEGWTVARNAVNLFNAEGPYIRGKYHVRNNGRATKIKVP